MRRCALAVLIVACFPATAHAQELTVYSSLPLSGASRASTRAINDGARLALQQAGGQAAGRPVRLVTLNDATAQAGAWTPERTAANARRAASDASTIAYIGEFNSGASKVSLPMLSEAGIPMISPSNTYNGMSTSGAGTEPGEPDKYYPTGIRNYFRLLPNDHVQAAVLVTAARDRGCRNLALLHDGEVYGRGIATDARATARRLGVGVALTARTKLRGSNRAVAQKARRAKADCMIYGGITANNAVRVFRDVARALPKAQLFGNDGVAESDFAAGLPRSVERRTHVTVATLLNTLYGLQDNEDPYKALGYEAMKVILDGINAVGADRQALINWLHSVQNRPSALGGPYGFDANGDTTLRAYGLYGITGRSLFWEGAVTAA